MTKPFSPRELAARVSALLGRSRSGSADPTAAARIVGDLRIDVDTRSVEVADQPAELTKIEFDLLLALSQRPGAVLSRAQLLAAVWGDNYIGDDHVVDVHIANLRKKIDLVDDGESDPNGAWRRLRDQRDPMPAVVDRNLIWPRPSLELPLRSWAP